MPFSPRGTLVSASLGFVVVLLDISVVNVALDVLRRAFATDVAGLQWVVNAYTLVFAALQLTGGALGDRFGPRTVFLSGFVLFTLASAVCGAASSLPWLIGSRAVQGMGAALLVPNSLSLLRRAFPDALARSRAVGWWGGIASVALAAGPVLGGTLVTYLGWRSIFWVNVPVGLLGVMLTLRYARPDERGCRRGLDFPGQGFGMLALAALTIGLTDVGPLGWDSPWVLGSLLSAVFAGAAFLRLESHSRSPMLPLTLFRVSAFTVASISGLVVNFAYYGQVFVFSLFFQAEQGLSPQMTGFAFLPMTAVLMVASISAGRLVAHVGSRCLMTLGMLVATAGYLLLLPMRIDGAYIWLVAPMLLVASGTALMVPTMTSIILASVDAARAGIASGILNSARQVGGLLGVSVFGYLVSDTAPQAFMRGMRCSMAIAAILLLAGGLLCWLGLDRHSGGVIPEA